MDVASLTTQWKQPLSSAQRPTSVIDLSKVPHMSLFHCLLDFLYCTVLYFTVLYCTVLYRAVLCCAVLCCAVYHEFHFLFSHFISIIDIKCEKRKLQLLHFPYCISIALFYLLWKLRP